MAEVLIKAIGNLHQTFANHKKDLIENQVYNDFSKDRSDTSTINCKNTVFKVTNKIK